MCIVILSDGDLKPGGPSVLFNKNSLISPCTYLISWLTNLNFIPKERKFRLYAENPWYYSVQTLLSSQIFFTNLKIIIKKKNNITSCTIWLRNMVSYIKGRTQVKGIWKQNLEENICAERRRMRSGEVFTMRNSIVCTLHLI